MKHKKKIEEPFDPERTPEPPQLKDPSMRRNEGQGDSSGPAGDKRSNENKTKPKDEKPKLLGESETEIDDETTI
jgi:hypothetical protein